MFVQSLLKIHLKPIAFQPVLSNKCFIHSPAGVIPKIIVFWLYWQQDFEWGFIEAGLLIKQRCTKPSTILAWNMLYG